MRQQNIGPVWHQNNRIDFCQDEVLRAVVLPVTLAVAMGLAVAVALAQR